MVVTVATDQSITGKKTFTAKTTFTDDIEQTGDFTQTGDYENLSGNVSMRDGIFTVGPDGSPSLRASTSPSITALAGEMNVGAPVPFASEEQAAAVLQGTRDEAAAGGTARRNDPFEYGDGGIGGQSPVTGAAGPQPAGQEGPGAGPPAEGGEWLNFLPHTDPRIQSELAAKAISLAQTINVQLTVTSAYRSPAYNQRVGGATNSYHTRGQALDITQTQFTQAQREQFVREAVRLGFGGIGIYNTFTHIDIGPARAWGSNGSRTSLPSWAAQAIQQAGRT